MLRVTELMWNITFFLGWFIVIRNKETFFNDSETCAHAAKIKLKISGGTRGEVGQKVRDTSLSLKLTHAESLGSILCQFQCS